jgi:hypothetical protein
MEHAKKRIPKSGAPVMSAGNNDNTKQLLRSKPKQSGRQLEGQRKVDEQVYGCSIKKEGF